jgi:hypothetical protein
MSGPNEMASSVHSTAWKKLVHNIKQISYGLQLSGRFENFLDMLNI